ncbi:putative phage integrase [Escherichia coli DEC3F]|uniref:Type 1 fimbriae Regulatory protein fimB n=1 Tax=Escherichia coli EC1870 TaxID=1005554 RepID=A0AAV3HGH4_ECOLX|nr:hypothetical protein ECH7EC4113_4252 [Escherichia coli O157:H7 str. EC4113]EHU66685.1 putative phage integrase [Escherichia coli DEC3B]EHU82647.1 putative phage integrase [Escherichia coli DEC3D]EHU84702.1 putative phage integrase [Escherichia coli DEC3E]EHU96340.1 putative phage integrase [Escherichia coli DEC3F]EHV04206.1 putative phage integrase [Escherichia coli DEC4B]EHV14330.1 putative phage integrase [Escherichia coli DEC4C]EHV18853.1 putative phage integrase [Escherichia coli DEC4
MNFLIYVYPILMHQENNLIFGGLKMVSRQHILFFLMNII